MTEYSKMNGFNKQNVNARKSLFVDVTYQNGTITACLVGPRIGEREATVVANAINAKLKECG